MPLLSGDYCVYVFNKEGGGGIEREGRKRRRRGKEEAEDTAEINSRGKVQWISERGGLRLKKRRSLTKQDVSEQRSEL